MEKTIIFGIAILSFLMGVPATSGMIPNTLQTSVAKPLKLTPLELNHQPIVVAENEQEATESGGQATGENEDKIPGDETKIQQKSSGNSNDASTKPLKSFKPSEEIAAEQAVDFPVDI